jgi:hypothetical protein
MKKFRRLKRGEKLSATWLNSLASEVERLGKIQVIGADSFSNGEDGIRVVFRSGHQIGLGRTGGSAIAAVSGTTMTAGTVTLLSGTGSTLSTVNQPTRVMYNAMGTTTGTNNTVLWEYDGERYEIIGRYC